MTTLKPSPFCGGKASEVVSVHRVHESLGGFATLQGVECHNRKCWVRPHVLHRAQRIAVRRWNRRLP